MIISHKHKFIFIKTNKTAGTSFEIALSKFCGVHDIITPIPHQDEILRKECSGRGPQNYILDSNNVFYNHASAEEIINIVGSDVWSSYYKFCFERNPWERVISFYYWRTLDTPNPNISDFIKSKEVELLKTKGYGLYTINDTVVVDKVYLYENLSSEIESISQDLGLPETLKLPFAKAGFRKDKRNYRKILNKSDMKTIRNLFSKEIELFNY